MKDSFSVLSITLFENLLNKSKNAQLTYILTIQSTFHDHLDHLLNYLAKH